MKAGEMKVNDMENIKSEFYICKIKVLERKNNITNYLKL